MEPLENDKKPNNTHINLEMDKHDIIINNNEIKLKEDVIEFKKDKLDTDDIIDPFSKLDPNDKDKLNLDEGLIHISDLKTLEKEVRVAMIGNVDSGKVLIILKI